MTNSLPDNLISRLVRVNVSHRSGNIDGKLVEWDRLVLTGTVKGKEFTIETKLEQKDITLLELSDTAEERQALNTFGQE